MISHLLNANATAAALKLPDEREQKAASARNVPWLAGSFNTRVSNAQDDRKGGNNWVLEIGPLLGRMDDGDRSFASIESAQTSPIVFDAKGAFRAMAFEKQQVGYTRQGADMGFMLSTTRMVEQAQTRSTDKEEEEGEEESYQIRAVTRSPKDDAAMQSRAKGVEVVYADLNKPDTLKAALKSVWGVFVSPIPSSWKTSIAVAKS